MSLRCSRLYKAAKIELVNLLFRRFNNLMIAIGHHLSHWFKTLINKTFLAKQISNLETKILAHARIKVL